jgi:hypothetical protein
VLLFLPPRLLYLLFHFLLSHYPPYLPSQYFITTVLNSDGLKWKNFLPLHYIISRSRFCRAGPGRPDLHTRAPSRTNLLLFKTPTTHPVMKVKKLLFEYTKKYSGRFFLCMWCRPASKT